MMRKISGMLIMIALLTGPVVFAASPWVQESTYAEQTGKKLEFGVKNIFFGWADIFLEPNSAFLEKRNLWVAFGKGLTDAFVNEVGGAVHLGSFFIPVDLPLPDNGVQIY